MEHMQITRAVNKLVKNVLASIKRARAVGERQRCLRSSLHRFRDERREGGILLGLAAERLSHSNRQPSVAFEN